MKFIPQKFGMLYINLKKNKLFIGISFLIALIPIILICYTLLNTENDMISLGIKMIDTQDETIKILSDNLSEEYHFGAGGEGSVESFINIKGSVKEQWVWTKIPRGREKYLMIMFDNKAEKTDDKRILYEIKIKDVFTEKTLTHGFEKSFFNQYGNPEIINIESQQISVANSVENIPDIRIESKEIEWTTHKNFFNSISMNLLLIFILSWILIFILFKILIKLKRKLDTINNLLVNKLKENKLLIGISFLIACISIVFIYYNLLTTNMISLGIKINDKQDETIKVLSDNLSEEYHFGAGGEGGFSSVINLKGSKNSQWVWTKIPRGREKYLMIIFDNKTEKIDDKRIIHDIKVKDFFGKKTLTNGFEKSFFNQYGNPGIINIDNQQMSAVYSAKDILDIRIESRELEWTTHKNIFAITIKLLIIFMIIWGLLFIIFKTLIKVKKNQKRKQILYSNIIFILIIPFVINFFTIFILKNDFGLALESIYSNGRMFFLNSLLILFSYLILMIIGYTWIPTAFLGVLTISVSIINYYKIMFRGDILYIWDINIANEAISVVNGLNLKFTKTMWSSIFILIILILLSCLISKWRAKKSFSTIKFNILVSVIGLISLIIIVNSVFLKLGFNSWNPRSYQEGIGLFGSLISTTKLISVEEPGNYSEETMKTIGKEITEKYNTNDILKDFKPNIVMIMSEGFWDITQLSYIEFDEEILPNINNIREVGISGYHMSPTISGATLDSEFEALTAFPRYLLPREGHPYLYYVNSDFFSYANFLKKHGYETIAMHPNKSTNYRRNVVYPYLGFNKEIFESDFIKPEIQRNYISDMELSKRIIHEYEELRKTSKAPLFNFNVSMQNHLGYNVENFNEEELVKFKSPGMTKDLEDNIKDFATGLHITDKALGYLMDYFEKINEPTIIIFFGDHMTTVGKTYEDIFKQTGYFDEGYNYTTQHTKKDLAPIVVWNNFNNIKYDLGEISTFQLLPTVLNKYNLLRPLYFNFIEGLSKISKGYTRGFLLDKDGKWTEEMNNEQKEIYDKLNLIEYDYIFGKRYLEDILYK